MKGKKDGSKTAPKKLDLVTLGETMIRHFTRHQERLEQSRELGFSVAGAESNVAIAAARVGLSVGWMSRLVRNPLGEKIEREVRIHGVDTSRVGWTDRGRVGTYYIEFGSKPRPTHVTYDREGSAASRMRPEHFDWDYVAASKWFHTTGITCALGKGCLETVRSALECCRDNRTKISFDLNYRAKLWSPGGCRKVVAPLLSDVDLFISSDADLEKVFGVGGNAQEQARAVQEEWGPETVLITQGSRGALARTRKGKVHEISFDRYPVKEVDRIGTGDAYAAGFLAGLMEKDIKWGLEFGAGLCALKYSIPGDPALVSREEVLEVIEGSGGGVRR